MLFAYAGGKLFLFAQIGHNHVLNLKSIWHEGFKTELQVLHNTG